MFSGTRQSLLLFSFIATLSFAGGCVSSPESMTPSLTRSSRTEPGSVSVTAIGGNVTKAENGYVNQFWDPKIALREFSKAVEHSIKECEVFQSIRDSAPTDFRLEANLRAMDQPVQSEINYRMLITWKLTDARSSRVIWEADVVSSDKGSIEGAAKDNIRQALESLERAVPLSRS